MTNISSYATASQQTDYFGPQRAIDGDLTIFQRGAVQSAVAAAGVYTSYYLICIKNTEATSVLLRVGFSSRIDASSQMLVPNGLGGLEFTVPTLNTTGTVTGTLNPLTGAIDETFTASSPFLGIITSGIADILAISTDGNPGVNIQAGLFASDATGGYTAFSVANAMNADGGQSSPMSGAYREGFVAGGLPTGALLGQFFDGYDEMPDIDVVVPANAVFVIYATFHNQKALDDGDPTNATVFYNTRCLFDDLA